MQNSDIVFSKRLALQVERYHTWPHVRGQSVGEHTAQVMRIYVELFGVPPKEVWLRILEHDMPEVRTGDLPFSAEQPGDEWAAVKAAYTPLERVVADRMGLSLTSVALTEVERTRVKIADLLECMEWGVGEWRLGSHYGLVVARNVAAPAMLHAERLSPEERTAVSVFIENHLDLVDVGERILMP